MAKKRVYKQRWSYERYFSGEGFINTDVTVDVQAVEDLIDQKEGRGNWRRSTLKKVKKVKA